MSLRQTVLASSFAVAHVNALQLDLDRADVHPLENVENKPDTSHFVNWNLCGDAENKNVAKPNNLGGVGPDKGMDEEMRVVGAKKIEIGDVVHVLDLVVTKAPGTEYSSNSPEINRVQNCMGYVNVETDHYAKLNFKFSPTGTSETWKPPASYVPKFKFTILDMDGNKNCMKGNETKYCVQEQVTFDTPIDHVYVAENHEFHSHGDNTADSPLIYESGMVFGNGKDNPKLIDGVLHLEKDQADRGIEVLYKGITEWSITFKAKGKSKSRKRTGRNFMWLGASDIDDPESCPEWAAPTFDWNLCKSDLSSNNLGGQGPVGADDENAEREIRYTSVATVHGKALDLRVTAEDEYTPYNVSRNTVITDRSDASIHGCYGAINVKAASKVQITFAFIVQETGEIAELEKDEGFGFSVFDIDQSNDNNNEERVYFDTPYAWEAFEGAQVEKVEDKERTFRSTAFGSGSDNIYDKDDANSDDQIARTVKVMYNGERTGGKAQWKVTFDVRGGLNGRNFLFGGCVHKKEDVAHPEL